MTSSTSPRRGNGVGPLLREWRGRRRQSQLDLASESGVSTKHLSHVETGRSQPSPELLLHLAHHLEIPLRDRNTLLLAAGYAPRYPETSLHDPISRHVRVSIDRMLAAHDPYPGLAIDRHWNVVMANPAAARLTATLPPDLTTPTVNLFRAGLHPEGLAAITSNFEEWAEYLLGQLHQMALTTGDPELTELESEVLGYANVVALDRRATPQAEPPLLVPCRLRVDGQELSMFTTMTTFGTPRDITLDELAVELFFPADDATEAALRG